MNFFAKIEQLINMLLLKFGELLYRLVPAPVKRLIQKIQFRWQQLVLKFKSLPSHLKKWALNALQSAKKLVTLKAVVTDVFKNATANFKDKSIDRKTKFKKALLAPMLVVGQWLNGLTPVQSMMLLAFTGLSVLSAIGIGFSGKRMVDAQVNTLRMPASVEEVEYDRPGYYKKQHRHFEMTNFRLPVYFAQINQIKSVDIDFTATLSNRQAKKFLEKHEFHLRDHLILQVEPSVSSFPLEEEGKEIIRQKVLAEINDFLIQNEIIGEVTELKITYVLAN